MMRREGVWTTGTELGSGVGTGAYNVQYDAVGFTAGGGMEEQIMLALLARAKTYYQTRDDFVPCPVTTHYLIFSTLIFLS